MNNDFQRWLSEAAGREKEQIPQDNPYREIGFDDSKKRLGWAQKLKLAQVEDSIEKLSGIIKNKKYFIFIGMGGSVNGIKPLLKLFPEKSIYTIDSLDPAAINEILEDIDDLGKTLVVPISKSGTTKETQLLALTFKEALSKGLEKGKWQNHFLWLSDAPSFSKLDGLGWPGVNKVTIQFNSESDIGGRFSCPHTLIFALPLFILLDFDLDKLLEIYQKFSSLKGDIQQQAYSLCQEYNDKTDAYFSPAVPQDLEDSFSPWIVQLFQESLGSRLENLSVKTLVNAKEDFLSKVSLDIKIQEPVVAVMAQMYFFQLFVAYYAVILGINFVNQEFVEKYKARMRQLEGGKSGEEKIKNIDLSGLIEAVKSQINPKQKFIEIVLYFYPDSDTVSNIEKQFSENFNDKKTLIFIGSDWNHQSYQAAFSSKDTFFVLLTLASYRLGLPNVDSGSVVRNIKTLELIAQATYLTLEDKSILFSLISS